jgi:hypothetical protein
VGRLEDERAWLVEVATVVGLAVGVMVGLLVVLTSLPVLPLVIGGIVVWTVGSAVILVTAG